MENTTNQATNEKKITVRIREVYGQTLVYPVCENAHHFAKIAGHKTLTQDTVDRINALGYTIDVETSFIDFCNNR